MKILLIGQAGRLGGEPARAFARRGHTLAESGPADALDRARALAPDVIVVDTGAVSDHVADAPDLGGTDATHDVPVLAVQLDGRIGAEGLLTLVERIARPRASGAPTPAAPVVAGGR